MPAYQYRCPTCAAEEVIWSTIAAYDPDAPADCVTCRTPMRRVYDRVAFKMPLPGHLNPTVGRYVTGQRDFEDGLKEASEAATERTGIEHNYQPVDLRDAAALGVTGEGLGDTARKRHNEGRTRLTLPGVDV